MRRIFFGIFVVLSLIVNMLLTWTSVQTNANMSDLYENSMNHSIRIASDPDERYEMGVRFDGNQTTGLKTLVKFDGNLTLIRSLQLFATLCNSLQLFGNQT